MAPPVNLETEHKVIAAVAALTSYLTAPTLALAARALIDASSALEDALDLLPRDALSEALLLPLQQKAV